MKAQLNSPRVEFNSPMIIGGKPEKENNTFSAKVGFGFNSDYRESI